MSPLLLLFVGVFARQPADVAALIAKLSTVDAAKAAIELRLLGAPAVPLLIDALRDPNVEVHPSAVEIPGEIGDSRATGTAKGAVRRTREQNGEEGSPL
jgi:hypothetical protein